ncbi:hypothetical protein AZG88_46200 [Rhodococcus sp. LB1]|nr:hypothetical protein AZG88_46200 [Rhodococcus sp. LB1]
MTLRETVSSHSTRDREWVDRVHLVSGRRQRLHPQAAVGFDADHDLPCLFGVGGYQFVQFTDAGQPVRQPTRRQPPVDVIHQVHVEMVFAQSSPTKIIDHLLRFS